MTRPAAGRILVDWINELEKQNGDESPFRLFKPPCSGGGVVVVIPVDLQRDGSPGGIVER